MQCIDSYFDYDIYEREVKQPQAIARKAITALAKQMIKKQFPLEEDHDDTGGAEA